MTITELKQAARSLCSQISGDFLEDFFAKMDDDYFTTFPPEDVATHIQMVSVLDEDRPIQARITPLASNEPGEFEIVVVGFDYLSQFSILCGLLSAFALDIRAGDIYSYAKGSGASKVVDVFKVALMPGENFDEARQQEFTSELQTLARLLSGNAIEEARMRLYRFLTERIERMSEPLSGLLSDVVMTFDNRSSPAWTVMEVESDDTFAFLYAVSNALSMRGIYISRVRIRSVSNRTHDEFFIADQWGGKLQKSAEQNRLMLAVRTIKQFTRFITEAPDPAKAMHHFDQLLDKLIEAGGRKVQNHTLSLLAQLLGSSDDLWDTFLRVHFTELIPMIEAIEADANLPAKAGMQRALRAAIKRAGASGDLQKSALNAYKDRQLFRIDVQHLLRPDSTLAEFSRSLTDLAEVVIDEASRIHYANLVRQFGQPKRPDDSPCAFAIFGLGKFGGREMGYASDLELLFVHEEGHEGEHSEFFTTLAHRIVDFIETRDKGIFHIDLRLRPHGEAGTWSTSFAQFTKYYSIGGDAAPFERQALIKLRWCGGDEKLGRRVEAHRDSFTYGGQPWDWEDALHLRERQMKELVKPKDVNVKYSAGGIIDIEYAVQYLQLLNGKEHPEIRVPTTLDALYQLRRLQIVREDDYHLLHSSYLFLRKVIDALRIVRGNAGDLVLPAESDDSANSNGEFKSLARRMGYREKDRRQSAALLAQHIREAMEQAHTYFINRFARQ